MRWVDGSYRSPCMDFLPPSGGVFRLSHLGVIAGYPMQTVMRFSRCGARFGNKKSPHNNLNLTIPSGMALVRVRYVAIRKSKTCSGSFGSRAETLSKYVILNCWDRLPQKSSCVNKNFWEYATFGSLQESTRKTLVKREKARQFALFDTMCKSTNYLYREITASFKSKLKADSLFYKMILKFEKTSRRLRSMSRW